MTEKYTPTEWKDQDVDNPKTYILTDNGDGTTTLTDAFGIVVEEGTAVNAENLNKIENELVSLNDKKADINLMNTNAISNCLITKGLNLKLTYSTTQLSIGIDSIIIKPNGSTFTLTESIEFTNMSDGIWLCFVNTYTNKSVWYESSTVVSSNINPSSSDTSASVWYNYNTLAIWQNEEGTWTENNGLSIPCLHVLVKDSRIFEVVSLEAFSFMGKVIFITPGTSFAIPNGYDETGNRVNTLIENTTLTQDVSARSSNGTYKLCISDELIVSTNSLFSYDSNTNSNRNSETLETQSVAILGKITIDNESVITALTAIQPFSLSNVEVESGEISDQVQADWDQTDSEAASFIQNKESVTSVLSDLYEKISELGGQTQSDWNQTDSEAASFIQNKESVTSVLEDLYAQIGEIGTILDSINGEVVE